MSTNKLKWLGLAAMAALPLTPTMVSAAPTAEELEFFESRVRPVLVETCYKCHAADSEKVKGGLQLDSKDALLKGGTTGPAVVPGNAERSLLIKAIRYTDPNLQMPPKDKLTEQQIADLEAWVKMGAPDPRTGKQGGILKTDADREKAKQHWAFQPIKQPATPTPKDIRLKKWVQSPVDEFILAKMDDKGLLPSFPADRWTLIRRAYFDLTGLPPTDKEVDEFVKDESPEAFAKVVDRLLASPQYGERWGRYWLDIARYADTKGRVNNNGMMDDRLVYSHTYRDYVINAFNEDLPYNRFIIEQVAADQVAKDRKTLAAMGFLTLGRDGNQQEVIDDRIDVLTRGTLGLSVYCARCHDHKFDPIPTKDYYSLYGVFDSSVEPREKPLLTAVPDTAEYKDYIGRLTDLETKLDNFRNNTLNKYQADAKAKAEDYMVAAHNAESSDKRVQSRADQATFEKETGLKAFMFQQWQNIIRNRARPNDPVWGPYSEFNKLAEKDYPTKGKELATKFYNSKTVNPQVAKSFSTPPQNFKAVAERYARLFNEADRQWQVAVTLYEKKKSAGKDENMVEPKSLPDPAMEALRKVFYGQELNVTYDRLAGLNNNAIRRQEDPILAKMLELNTSKMAPPRAMAMEDRNPRNARVMIKGTPSNLGPEVPRQFLEVLSGPDRKPFKKGSGRLELAESIASKNNPLTARVIVNRIWMNHFGFGIVRSASDFGLRADEPTHPELLDYLATWFMDNGWSIKKLHRQIMLSSVYQQGSDENPKYAIIDPSNLYLWKMNRRRLDFESFRDSLLAVGGKLDLTVGGIPVNFTDNPNSGRRTVYGYIDRRNLTPMFRTFDFANPDTTVGQRFNSTVPQQALFMMNSPFVTYLARSMVERTDIKSEMDDERRIDALYHLAYQRSPSPSETKLGRRFLEVQSGVKQVVAEPVWKYGFGEYDDKAKKLKGFNTLVFNGRAWQLNMRTPDPRIGMVLVDANGGQPGNTKQHSAIRRWTAPRDGFVSIDGALGNQGKDGDGVQGYIVSSRSGELGRWSAFKNRMDAKVARVEVKKGDTLDFIVDFKAKGGNDAFTWSPTIKMIDNKQMAMAGATDAMAMGSSDEVSEWKATGDFGAAKASAPKPLGTWEKYTQVLLLSNEMTFVD